MVDIQSTAAEIGEKKRRKIEITGPKYNGLPYYIGRPMILHVLSHKMIFAVLDVLASNTMF